MARTKFVPVPKKKSRRTKPVKKNNHRNPRFYNLGGFMIDPPETCMKQIESEDGAWWTDLGLCRHCDNKCDRYKSYIKMTQAERTEDGLDRGIYPVKKWE